MIGKLLKGRYQILQVLSAGAFGQTYIAEDTFSPGNPKCVVKHLKIASTDPSCLTITKRRFIIETEALKQLGHHERIPQLIDCFYRAQEFCLVQEFIQGHPLSEELPLSRNTLQTCPQDKHWTESQVIQLLQEVLDILEFVHNQGLIHCDLKPDNLVRRVSDGKLFLIDFGAVQPVRMSSSPQLLLPTQQQLNKTLGISPLGYLPAEQLTGHPFPSSDIYALALIGIQALTGLEPSQLQINPNTAEVSWQHLCKCSTAPALSLQLAFVLNQMIRYDYKDRYQTASEALQALQHLSVSPQRSRVVALVGMNASGEKSELQTPPPALETMPLLAEPPEIVSTNSIDETPWSASLPPHEALNSSYEEAHSPEEATQIQALTLVHETAVSTVNETSLQESGVKSKALAIRNHNYSLIPYYVSPKFFPLITGMGVGMVANVLVIAVGLYSLLNAFPSDTEANTLMTAQEQYQAGDIEKAIALAKSIPANSPTYSEAQAAMRQWRQDWNTAAAQYRSAEQAFNEGRWLDVLTAADKIPDIAFWQYKLKPLVEQAQPNVEAEAQALLQKAYEYAAQKDFTSALKYLQQIPPDTQTAIQADKKLAEYTDKQHIQADRLLQKAYESAAKEDFTKAISVIQQISLDIPASEHIEQKLIEYTQKQHIQADRLLERAYESAAEEDFTTALEYLQQIPQDTPAYEQAQILITEYQEKQRLQTGDQKTNPPTPSPKPQLNRLTQLQPTVGKMQDLNPGNHLQEIGYLYMINR